MSFQKISSEAKAKIAEIAEERNMSPDLTKEIISGVLKILENAIVKFEGEVSELEGYIHCLEINFDNLEKTNAAQRLKYRKLLKENSKLKNRITAFEAKKPELNLS